MPVSVIFNKIKTYKSPFIVFDFPELNLQLHWIKLDIYLNEKPSLELFQDLIESNTQIQTIILWEDLWQTKQPIIKNRLLSKFGLSKRIHGRKTIVKRIDKAIAQSFMKGQHLQGYSTGYYKYGLYEKEILYAVALFSKTRKMRQENYISAELIRYANLDGHHVSGGLSKLINHYIQEHNPSDIMTYVDRDWGNGSGYHKIGFSSKETTLPQAFWVHTKTFERYHPLRFCKEYGVDINLPIQTILKQYNLIEVYNSGNIKMIKLC